jgi:predicted small lipoprotein YifL
MIGMISGMIVVVAQINTTLAHQAAVMAAGVIVAAVLVISPANPSITDMNRYTCAQDFSSILGYPMRLYAWLVLCVPLTLTACGQKGSLVLPKSTSSTTVQPTAEQQP